MRRTVLAQPDGVVGVDEDRAQLHERRQPQRVAPVVGESEEGAHVGNEPTVQSEPVGDRVHAELAHAEVDVIAGVFGRDRLAARPGRQHRPGQIGRAADQFRQRRRERFDRLLRGLAGGDRIRLGGLRAHQRGGARAEVGR